MNRNYWVLAAAVGGYLLGTLGPSGASAQRAAQDAPGAGGARFQISAFAGQTRDGDTFHGCYLADTTTGDMWLTIPGQGQKAQQVSQRPR